MGPQCAMGLSVIVVFADHMFLLEYVGPQYAMGLSVFVAFASHILFYLKVCGFSRRRGVVCFVVFADHMF